ncbi:PHD finger protein 11-like [Meriones unguiculatus]|uniref:PHD finger protein 11-like n=1 Tax=Meriones unguiculatus TaxID=10047 RepID=UPI00293E34FA|nr:PHD finger protein 11-like [Meriones unguiculatus]
MEKRTCALCPKGHDWSVIYFTPSVNIAAHENCLATYLTAASGTATPQMGTVASGAVQKMAAATVSPMNSRGPRLPSKGHDSPLVTAGSQVLEPSGEPSGEYLGEKGSSSFPSVAAQNKQPVSDDGYFAKNMLQKQEETIQSANKDEFSRYKRHMTEKPLSHTVIRSKAYEHEERQRHLKQQLEVLGDLKQILCSLQENVDQDHLSSTSRSLEDNQFKCQESAEMQTGSADSL